jgi:hypothetical protein
MWDTLDSNQTMNVSCELVDTSCDIRVPDVGGMVKPCREQAVILSVPVKAVDTLLVLLGGFHFFPEGVLWHIPEDDTPLHPGAYQDVVLFDW